MEKRRPSRSDRPRLPPSTAAGKRRRGAERAESGFPAGFFRNRRGGAGPPRGGASRGGAAAAGRGLARDPVRGEGRGLAAAPRGAVREADPAAAATRRAARHLPPSPAPGAAVMRLALLWALGLLGAGSPLPFPSLPGTRECGARSGPGGDWKEAQGGREASGYWGQKETLGDPNQSAAGAGLRPWARAGDWAMERRGKDHPRHGPRGQLPALVPAPGPWRSAPPLREWVTAPQDGGLAPLGPG